MDIILNLWRPTRAVRGALGKCEDAELLVAELLLVVACGHGAAEYFASRYPSYDHADSGSGRHVRQTCAGGGDKIVFQAILTDKIRQGLREREASQCAWEQAGACRDTSMSVCPRSESGLGADCLCH